MNIHVAALRRPLVGWLIIAAVVGGAGYWLGLGQISKQSTSLAQNEVNRLTPLIVKRINGNRADRRTPEYGRGVQARRLRFD